MSANSQPPSPKERLTAYSFNCFSQPPYPYGAIYIVNLKALILGDDFKILWACLLTGTPPSQKAHIQICYNFVKIIK